MLLTLVPSASEQGGAEQTRVATDFPLRTDVLHIQRQSRVAFPWVVADGVETPDNA
jgi:hypothetical protein